MDEKPRFRGGNVVGPVLLIGLGIVLLLQQNGLLQWSIWEVIFRLWPILIVAVGAEVLLGRRSFVGSVVAVAVSLMLLMGGIWLLGRGSAMPAASASETTSVALGDFTRVDLAITQSAGKITFDSLPASSTDILKADLKDVWIDRVAISESLSGKTKKVEYRKTGPDVNTPITGEMNVWAFRLLPSLPAALDINLGAGEVITNLAALSVDSYQLNLGAGSVELELPAAQAITVKIRVGAGSVHIRLPKNAEVRIDCSTGLGNCSLPNGSGFWARHYASPGASQTSVLIVLDISVGAGEVVVE